MGVRTALVLLVCLAGAAACGDRGQNAGVPDAPIPARETARARVARDVVLVIAHRGASTVAPENTLPALRAGVQAGADLVELDYHHSSDGHPVVFHDETLDRTTDAVARWGEREIPLASRPLADLRKLDAGLWFESRFAGTTIPTLGEALDTIQDGSLTLIERKAGDADTLFDLLESKRLVAQVVVQSFDWGFLEACRRRSAECVLVALGSKALSPDRLDRVVGFGAAAVAWNHKHVTPALAQAVHARGLRLWVYTVDDLERARALVDLGVDAVITNKPAAVRAALR